MAYYLDSIQGIDPLDLVNASTTDKERNVVVKLPEKLASIGQMPAAQALSSRDSISASTARPLSRKSPNRALQPTNRVAEVVPRVRSGETLQENAKTAQRKDAHVASSQESRGHYGSLSNHHKYPSSGSNRMQPRQQSSKRTVSRPFTFATGKRQRENPSQV